MRLSDHQAAFTADIARLVRCTPLVMPGYRVRLMEVARSVREQEKLVQEGKSWVRDPASAPHVERRAADLALDKLTEHGWEWITNGDEYEPLGEEWESYSEHNRWGGRFGDGNHFERIQVTR